MIISDEVFKRMKDLKIYNGVFLFVSNSKQALREEAPAFAHSLLNYTQKDVALNEKIFITDTDNISAEMANAFIEFESKRAVNVASKILIMHDVELLKDNISDKLLKVIEDHHNDSLIILTTTSLENVSRTIRSRCMVFKDYTETEDYFVTFRNKYLSFIDKIKEKDYLMLPNIIEEMTNLGSMNIIQAMFTNCEDIEYLEIAKNALFSLTSGSKDAQVNTYLVHSVWCLENNLRRWANVNSTSRQ
jgi:DNA polymerase III delta prime subunit